jgi:SAM-dependent methyltransferase
MVRVVSRRLQTYVDEGKAAVRLADVEMLPYPVAEFTKVCSVNTLYFWNDPAVALAECHRVLLRGGQLLLCFNSKKDLEAWPIHRYGFRLYELAEVEALLKAAGFSSIQVVDVHDKDQGLFYCVSSVAAS